MKKIIIIIGLMVLAFLTVSKLLANKKEVEDRVYQYDEKQEVYVSADVAKIRPLSSNKIYTGSFEPFREIKVMPEAQGKVTQFNVNLGQYFKKGQVVAQLDNALQKLQLETIDVQMEGFQKDIKRYTILNNADAIQGVQLEKTELALKAAKVQRKTVEEQIRRTTVYAPFSGVVTHKFAEIGAMAAPAAPLIQLTDISSLYLTLRIPESDLHLFKKNQMMEVSVNSIPEKTFKGKITMIGTKGDVAHNFPIQIKISNPKGHPIKAGMYGEISYQSTLGENKISIPSSAIVGSVTQPQVYLIENGKALLKNVTLGERMSGFTFVNSGLKEGDQIVTSGFINLRDGANVKLQ